VEDEILPTCRELGITLVAYSPLGRGLLAGAFTRERRPAGEGEFRATGMPRFAPGNYERNLELADTVKEVALRRRVSPAQIALAWVLQRGDDVVTIPGTTRLEHLASNLAALDVELTPGDLEELGALGTRVRGDRYNPAGMAAVQE
jgi:aryl-alcohol dehydrogenase-like predicted oxidoreductase